MASRQPAPNADNGRRQQSYDSAGTIGARFPKAGRFSIELNFSDPTGVLKPSSFRQIYEPAMQAYFDLRCPLQGCNGGGFDLNAQVADKLGNAKLLRSGAASCSGSRPRTGVPPLCGLELAFTLVPEQAD